MEDDKILEIPLDPDNTHYAEIMRQVDAGELTIEPADVTDVWIKIRAERDSRLAETDWTHGGDSPLGESKKTEWATYRIDLRDIPADQSSEITYADITWPTKPE